MHATRSMLIVTLTAALALTAGCGGRPGSDKVGAPVQPVTLTLADTNKGTATPPVLAFVRTVDRLSRGAVKIRVVTAPNTTRDYEVDVVKGVRAGTWDLGWIGGRTLDSVGVPAAGVLQVPFLIDSYATERKVLLGPIGKRLTKDMSKAGVTGLGLLPDRLRYLVTTKPIDSPADLHGEPMRAFGGSRSQAAAWQALGAKAVPLNGTTDAAVGQMKRNRLLGFDTDTTLWGESAYTGATLTLGAPIWPRTTALFAAPKQFASFPKATQALLRDAAARVAQEQTGQALAADDAEALYRVCALGGRVTVLDAQQRAAFLEAGAASARAFPAALAPPALVAQITALKSDTAPEAPPELPASCATANAAPSPTPTRARRTPDPALEAALKPGSVYRSRASSAVLRALFGANFAKNNAGTYTFRFESGGRWTWDQKPPTEIDTPTHGEGAFFLDGDVLDTTFDGSDGEIHERARCKVVRRAIDCRIVFDDGGLTTDRRLGFQGMTEPLVPLENE